MSLVHPEHTMTTTPARQPRPHVEDQPPPADTTRSAADATPADPAPPGSSTTGGVDDTKDLKGLRARDLLSELAAVEAGLRDLPFLVTRQGRTGVNPEVARLLARQRAVVEQLRRRRVTWTSSATPRGSSAAWPPPPWT
jgi:hypothetical protein